MQKSVVYKIFSYHFGKVILNKRELTDYIRSIDNEYEKRNLERLSLVFHKYKDNEEYLEVDDLIIKAMKENFNLVKSELYDKVFIDNKLYRIFFEYFNEFNDKNHSFKVLANSQKDLLFRLSFLDIDYGLIIKRQTRTLQDIGDELGYTRERIRQKVNENKNILKSYIKTLHLNYISYEDIGYLPTFKQAIIYASDDFRMDEVGMYVFDERLRKFIVAITNKFKIMLINEQEGIDDLMTKNYDILKRYIENDDGFYTIRDEVYTIYNNSDEKILKFFFNYLTNLGIDEFMINKQFVDKFRSSLHGKLFEERINKKVTQKSLKTLIEDPDVLNIGKDIYLYKPHVFDKLNKDYLKMKLERNLPIKGRENLKYIFEEDIKKNDLNIEHFYYYLKRIMGKEYKFFKFNVEKL